LFPALEGIDMAGRDAQTWRCTFTQDTREGDQQTYFSDIPTVMVQVRRILKEPRIRIICGFNDAQGPGMSVEIKSGDPPFVTRATGLTVYATPLDFVAPDKTEAVEAVWPFTPRKPPKPMGLFRRFRKRRHPKK
jgi:hypothetical protein